MPTWEQLLIWVLAAVAYFSLVHGILLTVERRSTLPAMSARRAKRTARKRSPRNRTRIERYRDPRTGELTTMALEFKTAKKRKDVIEITIDGDLYHFTPQKSAGAMLALAEGDYAQMMKKTFDWLGDGLPEPEAERLINRLKDKDDDFDIADLQEVIRILQDEISGRPTTS